jgi:arginine deiminase
VDSILLALKENFNRLMKDYGCQNMVKSVKKILLKHPKNAYQNQEKINKEASKLNYLGNPDFDKSCTDFDLFIGLLKSFDCEIHYLPAENTSSIDSIYTHDPCLVTNKGAIYSNMGKLDRSNEPNLLENYFKSIGVPTLGKIEYPGTLEGGDIVWLNERTIAVGEGYRSNAEGILQLQNILGSLIDNIITVPLPHWTGPKDCLHLMSNISPIDEKLFLVYSKLLPVSFRSSLLDMDIELVEVPDKEYLTMGCNVLAVAPKKVIMIDGNPITKNLLLEKNVEVHLYDGSEISFKGSGGPTCLTRPFLRT